MTANVVHVDTKPLTRLAEGSGLFLPGSKVNPDPLFDATELLMHAALTSPTTRSLEIATDLIRQLGATTFTGEEERLATWRAAIVLLLRGFLASGKAPYPLRESAVGALVGLGAIAGAGRQMPESAILRNLAHRLGLADYRATISKTLKDTLESTTLDNEVREAAELLLNERIRTQELRNSLAMKLYAISAPEPLRHLADSASIPYRAGEWRLVFREGVKFPPSDYLAAKAILRLKDMGLAKAFLSLKRDEKHDTRLPGGIDAGRRRMLAMVLLRNHLGETGARNEDRLLAVATALALTIAPGDTARAAAEDLLRVLRAEFPSSSMLEPVRRWVNGVLDPVENQRELLEPMMEVIDPPSDPSALATPELDEYVYRSTGGGWEIRFEGETGKVPDLDGFFYLAELLQQPGESIPSIKLDQARHPRGPAHATESQAMDEDLSIRDGVHEMREEAPTGTIERIKKEIEKAEEELGFAKAAGNEAEIRRWQETIDAFNSQALELSGIGWGRGDRKTLKNMVHGRVKTAISKARAFLRRNKFKRFDKHLNSFYTSQSDVAHAYCPPDPAPPWKFR